MSRIKYQYFPRYLSHSIFDFCVLLCQSVFAIFSNEFLPCSQGFIIVCNRMRNMLRKKAQYLSHSITVFLFIIVSGAYREIFFWGGQVYIKFPRPMVLTILLEKWLPPTSTQI